MNATADLQSRVEELNEVILEGKILEAFDAFYAEDGDKRVGFEADRKYEEQFVGSFEAFRDAEAVAVDPVIEYRFGGFP